MRTDLEVAFSEVVVRPQMIEAREHSHFGCAAYACEKVTPRSASFCVLGVCVARLLLASSPAIMRTERPFHAWSSAKINTKFGSAGAGAGTCTGATPSGGVALRWTPPPAINAIAHPAPIPSAPTQANRLTMFPKRSMQVRIAPDYAAKSRVTHKFPLPGPQTPIHPRKSSPTPVK